MNRSKIAAITLTFALAACASFNAYEKGRSAERVKNWDEAVIQYMKALDIDPDNMRYQMNLQRAKLEASRVHFEKGKTLEAAAFSAKGERSAWCRSERWQWRRLKNIMLVSGTQHWSRFRHFKTTGGAV